LLKPHVPAPFTLETIAGQAWISVVLFSAKNSRLRFMPSVISYPTFLQMNIRTYVHFNGEPGIYFLSVDVNHLLTMTAAKKVLQLPYELAEMNLEQIQDQLLFSSKRLTNHEVDRQIIVKYQPQVGKVPHKKGTLSYRLT